MHVKFLNPYKFLALLACVAAVSVHGTAAAQDLGDERIEVMASSVEVSRDGSQQMFRGGVVIVQGSFTLKGDQVVVLRQNDGLESLVVTGAPAQFVDTGNNLRTAFDGSSRRITIDYAANNALLEGDVEFNRRNLYLQAQMVDYDLSTGKYRITGAPKSDGQGGTERLRVIINN